MRKGRVGRRRIPSLLPPAVSLKMLCNSVTEYLFVYFNYYFIDYYFIYLFYSFIIIFHYSFA